jgi:hypothetical protein
MITARLRWVDGHESLAKVPRGTRTIRLVSPEHRSHEFVCLEPGDESDSALFVEEARPGGGGTREEDDGTTFHLDPPDEC